MEEEAIATSSKGRIGAEKGSEGEEGARPKARTVEERAEKSTTGKTAQSLPSSAPSSSRSTDHVPRKAQGACCQRLAGIQSACKGTREEGVSLGGRSYGAWIGESCIYN